MCAMQKFSRSCREYESDQNLPSPGTEEIQNTLMQDEFLTLTKPYFPQQH